MFQRLRGNDRLGRPFAYEVDLLSESPELDFADFLGQRLTVELDLQDGRSRYFDGLASRFRQMGTSGRYHWYRATLRPWIWFLGRTRDCRIFQDLDAVEIVKQVFGDHPFAEFEDALTGSYRTRGYCVQYRESDLDFVTRLMEEEGIYYYFEHRRGRHTLVLSDGYSAHESTPSYERIPYFPPGSRDRHKRDHLYAWQTARDLRTGSVALDDFDFERPKADLGVMSAIPRDHALADLEVFDYPGGYVRVGDGEHYARTAIEAEHGGYEVAQGEGTARGLAVGGLFELTGHPRADQDREYLCLAARYELVSDRYESANVSPGEIACKVACEAADSRQPYRLPRTTPKAVVRGPQTAVVVGAAGEEIHTDQYGRVKVQFHWDRYGKSDQRSSCWVRVAQVWAGSQWGAIHIPRIGQEVIVDFLEGDPDRPIVTGRVYNADRMPPYALPANKTQSGIKSRSTKGGGAAHYNEFRFEDKKGEEQVLLHAEKDQDIEVERDESHWVGHDRGKRVDHDETTTIGNDRTETVGHNETVTVGANRTETVQANETLTVVRNRSRTVLKNEVVTVALTRTHGVGVNEAISVGAAQEVTVGGGQAVTVGASRALTVGRSQNSNYGKDLSQDVGGDRSAKVGKDDRLDVGKRLTIEAGDEIRIETGKARIVMKKDGTILLQGKDITVKGSGTVNVKASKNVIIKGKKILEN